MAGAERREDQPPFVGRGQTSICAGSQQHSVASPQENEAKTQQQISPSLLLREPGWGMTLMTPNESFANLLIQGDGITVLLQSALQSGRGDTPQPHHQQGFCTEDFIQNSDCK